MKDLAIYKGKGASPTNARLLRQAFGEALHDFGTNIRFITEHDLNDPVQKWRDETDALIIGGGAYGQMKEATTPQARQGIHDFAMEKITAGICMGGYGLSAATFFTGQDVAKTSDGMSVYQGHAIGALPITPELYNGNSNSMCIVMLRHENYGLNFPASYWGGGQFQTLDKNDTRIETTVTLKVAHAPEPLALGVRIRHDQGGTTVLAGYHSEATKPSYISEWVGKFKSSEEDFERVQREINQYDRGRYYVGFAALLDDMGVIPHFSFVDHILSRPAPKELIVPLEVRPDLSPA